MATSPSLVKQRVSVVMSVYNNAEHVQRTIASVLRQNGVEFEFIIVDDGASDAVKKVLKEYAFDTRVKVLQQDNVGLTKALIRGCTAACHPFIARIDAGDEMAENRLSLQATLLQADDSIGIVTSWVTINTEEGYFLYDIRLREGELNDSLRANDGKALSTPFHSSVMFRKSIYDQVGGYRPQFYFTQDADLWSRMIEQSKISVIEQRLTVGVFSVSGISGRYKSIQQQLVNLVAEANRCRQKGLSEQAVLDLAAKLKPRKGEQSRPASVYDGQYFIASVLLRNGSQHAKEHCWRAFKLNPLHPRSWFILLRGLLV